MNEDYEDLFVPNVEGVVDPPAVVGPDPDLILEVVVELVVAANEVLDMGRVPPGVSGVVCAGCNLIPLPRSQRHLHPDEATLPELPHEIVRPFHPGEFKEEVVTQIQTGHEEIVSFLNILQALLHVPHGGVHNHVQEHLLIPKWIAEAQDDEAEALSA